MQPLLAKCREASPTEIELSALAAALHSFYTGAENLFKRVAIELDREPVRGEAWHRDLLQRMAQPRPQRPALLSEPLQQALLDYLRFRHVFRNAYSFDLDWQKLKPLVLGMERTFQDLERSLENFLNSGSARQESDV
jgi:hypothetical protein